MPNPYHEPAGSSKGGQFAPKNGLASFEQAARKAAGVSTKLYLDNPDDLRGRDYADETAKKLAKKWDPSQKTLDMINDQEKWGDLTKEEIVGNVLRDWTGSSGGQLQRMVLDGGLQAAGIDGTITYPENLTWLKNNSAMNVYSDLNDLGKIIYSDTQKMLSGQGIDFVHLYRQSTSTNTRLFSSWSTHRGGYITTDTSLKFLEADVPESQIFSIPSTGFGNIDEAEVVVIGNVEGITQE